MINQSLNTSCAAYIYSLYNKFILALLAWRIAIVNLDEINLTTLSQLIGKAAVGTFVNRIIRIDCEFGSVRIEG